MNAKERFLHNAIQMYPHIKSKKQITRDEILRVCEKYNIGYPQNTICAKHNSIARGVFKFEYSEPDTMINFESRVESRVESNDTIYNRIKSSYESLETIIDSVGNGHTRSLIVSGAPGIGKSHTVNEILYTNPNCEFTIIKGMVKATGIFKLLYENRNSNQVLVFDDSDEVFNNEISLNLLKAALELNKSRHISWLSEKDFQTEDGDYIPKTFEYQGGIIFLTNLDFLSLIAKGSKLSNHLMAIESRTIYYDLGVRTKKELLIRIQQVMETNNILAPYGISKYQESLLMVYLEKNVDRLRELSIRTLIKLSSLCLASPFEWEKLADNVLLNN